MKEKLTRLTSEDVRALDRVEIKSSRVETIAESLGGSVFGQDEACLAVARAVARQENGLNDPTRPLSVLFFAGPTGTGKTEMSRALSEYMFYSPKHPRLKIINCAEFNESHKVSILLGAPPGYVGYGTPPLIPPEFLRNKNIIVFDEIEKAHPDFWEALLSIMEEGKVGTRVGNALGAKEIDLDFTKSFLIFTSNVGAEEISSKGMGFNPHKSVQSDALGGIRRHFKALPEFLGRVDEFVVFKELKRASYEKIYWKFLDEINSTLGTYITTTQELMRHIVDNSIGEFGARDMRHAIDKILLQPLSDAMSSTDAEAFIADWEGEVVFYMVPREEEPEQTEEEWLDEWTDYEEETDWERK